MRNKFLNRYAKFNNLCIEDAKFYIKSSIMEALIDWMRKGGDDSFIVFDLAYAFADDFMPYVCDSGILEIEGAKYRINLDYNDISFYTC